MHQRRRGAVKRTLARVARWPHVRTQYLTIFALHLCLDVLELERRRAVLHAPMLYEVLPETNFVNPSRLKCTIAGLSTRGRGAPG